MMLATAAISGALECADCKRIRGLLTTFICCLLLPLTIPSNALVAPIIAAIVFLSTRKPIYALVPLVGGFLGGTYYFTIWDQFIAASKEPGGWDSAFAVATHLLLAFALHILVVLVCIPFKTAKDKRPNAADNRLKGVPMAISILSAIIIAATLVCSRKGQAPYPRVFLVFLPVASFAALLAARDSILAHKQIILPMLAIFAIGFGTEKLTSDMTRNALARGESPLNLLQQYYRGASELRVLAQTKFPEGCIVMTDAYDLPTMELYNAMNGRKEGLVASINGTRKGFAVTGPNRIPVVAIAKTPEIAATLLSHAGFGSEKELMDSFPNEDLPNEARMSIPYDSPDTIRQIYAPPTMRIHREITPEKDNSMVI